MPIWNNHAKIANALATHMNANMVVPISAPMFSSATLPMTFRKIMNMTVAMTDAAVTKRALRNMRKEIGKVHQRERTLRGVTNMRTKDKQAEVRKRPNMAWDASLIRSRMSLTSLGRLTKK
jgi:hypothetical protein